MRGLCYDDILAQGQPEPAGAVDSRLEEPHIAINAVNYASKIYAGSNTLSCHHIIEFNPDLTIHGQLASFSLQ